MTRVYCKKCNMLRTFYPKRKGDHKSKILYYEGWICKHRYTEKEIEKYRIVMRFFLPDGTEITFPKVPKGNVILIKQSSDTSKD